MKMNKITLTNKNKLKKNIETIYFYLNNMAAVTTLCIQDLFTLIPLMKLFCLFFVCFFGEFDLYIKIMVGRKKK